MTALFPSLRTNRDRWRRSLRNAPQWFALYFFSSSHKNTIGQKTRDSIRRPALKTDVIARKGKKKETPTRNHSSIRHADEMDGNKDVPSPHTTTTAVVERDAGAARPYTHHRRTQPSQARCSSLKVAASVDRPAGAR